MISKPEADKVESEHLQDEQFWSEAWVRHLQVYLAAPPRTGYWLDTLFGRRLSMLEIAGGSCRDSLYLAKQGVDVIGSDFDRRTLDYLAKVLPDSRLELRREDAFAFSIADKSIDLSFSNGFWILFDDDDDLRRLITEQARITRRYLVALVHNAENEKLVETFREKAKLDKLYGIRFYHRETLKKIVESSGISCKSIHMRKFGGFWDCLYASKLKGLPNPFRLTAGRMVPRLYQLQPWSETERIACIVELG